MKRTNISKERNLVDVEQVLLITVREGDGTKRDPARLVKYVYDTQGGYHGKIDATH